MGSKRCENQCEKYSLCLQPLPLPPPPLLLTLPPKSANTKTLWHFALEFVRKRFIRFSSPLSAMAMFGVKNINDFDCINFFLFCCRFCSHNSDENFMFDFVSQHRIDDDGKKINAQTVNHLFFYPIPMKVAKLFLFYFSSSVFQSFNK